MDCIPSRIYSGFTRKYLLGKLSYLTVKWNGVILFILRNGFSPGRVYAWQDLLVSFFISIIFLHLIVISLIPVRCPAADFPLCNNFHNCHPTLVFYSKIPVRSHPCFVMLFPPTGIATFIYFEFRPKLFVFPFQLRNSWRWNRKMALVRLL